MGPLQASFCRGTVDILLFLGSGPKCILHFLLHLTATLMHALWLDGGSQSRAQSLFVVLAQA